MAQRGGQPGNQNATKGKPWQQAIMRALEHRSRYDQKVALDELAGRLLDKCAEGDMSALKELGDRLDGKAAQPLVGGGADDPPVKIERVERVIVDPAD